jgi:hypothetical protein
MSNSNPTIGPQAAVARSLHTSQPASEFDTNHLAWVHFDRHLTAEIERHERKLERYLTRQTILRSLGR